MRVSEALEETEVFDPFGEARTIRSLLAGRPTIMVWLRHYGWLFCREQAARFNERLEEIEGKGAQVVAIGNGTPAMAEDFKNRFGVRFGLYTDPERHSYRVAGWRRPKSIGLKTFAHAGRALLGGHLQGRTKGDAFQLGGVVVVDGDGEVLFEHTDSEAGDHADVDQVIAALP